ncbi:MAG: fatty acid desaturase [Acidiferrobacteraceae bacterium]|nr:fatty acid desaturase [Acidiferrobacteraceae bacterium]
MKSTIGVDTDAAEEYVNLSASEIAQLRALYNKSDLSASVHLMAHLGLVVFTGLLVYSTMKGPLFFPCMLAMGIVMSFLFAPLHECIHRTAFRTRSANNIIAAILGFVLLLPPIHFRLFHMAHHRWTQVPSRDPELANKNLNNSWDLFLQISGYRYWTGNIKAIIGHAFGYIEEPYISSIRKLSIAIEARYYILAYVLCLITSLYLSSNFLLFYWIIPMLLGQPVLRLFLLAEHTLCSFSNDMLQNSRTTITNPFVRFMSWNMCFHAEHHACTAIPFHALPRAHQLLRNYIVEITHGYTSFNKILETKLKKGK